MFGWIMAAHQLGAATAAFGAGVIRTELDTYLLAFIIAGLLCLVAALMVLGIDAGKRAKIGGSPAVAGALH